MNGRCARGNTARRIPIFKPSRAYPACLAISRFHIIVLFGKADRWQNIVTICAIMDSRIRGRIESPLNRKRCERTRTLSKSNNITVRIHRIPLQPMCRRKLVTYIITRAFLEIEITMNSARHFCHTSHKVARNHDGRGEEDKEAMNTTEGGRRAIWTLMTSPSMITPCH